MNHLRKRLIMIPALIAALASQAAQAHPFGIHAVGFAAGLAHPFSGLDHLAALVAVGIWAAQLGGPAVWRVPAAFVATMSVGAGLAFAGIAVPAVETGVAASLLVLGLLVGLRARLPASAGMLLVGVFALFHGSAHGAELPLTGDALRYAMGLIVATAALHAVGVLAGWRLRTATLWMARVTGALLAGGGLVLLAA